MPAREYHAKWRAANRVRVRLNQNAWYANNREKRNADRRQRRKDERERKAVAERLGTWSGLVA